MEYLFGYPEARRKCTISELVKSSQDSQKLEYRGKYRTLPVIETDIELPVYRIENIRTKNLQKEWLAEHKDKPRDMFSADPYSIATQEAQHQILEQLIDKEGLFKYFQKELHNQQVEPLICSNNGIVVNGNRRLCAWRKLYYSNKEKYRHFKTIRIMVLPDSNPQGMYDLEIDLQLKSDMKAKYAWHAVAADYAEKEEAGCNINNIAQQQKKKSEDVFLRIACYRAAEQYLQAIGHPDEWSRVDKQEYAFQQIVKCRKKVNAPGEKELFKEICSAVLQNQNVNDRLYKQIPKVVQFLPKIIDKFQKKYLSKIQEPPPDLTPEPGSNWLFPNQTSQDNDQVSFNIIKEIRKEDNLEDVVKTVLEVIKSEESLEIELKNKQYLLSQVTKACTSLVEAVNHFDPSMEQEGVLDQIQNIEGYCTLLKRKLNENNSPNRL